MEFRKAVDTDIDRIMDIIGQAQTFLREHGIDQWQNGYPNRLTIKDDMDRGDSYVLTINGIVVGTVAIIFGIEKTYKHIYNGKWLSDDEYATIHRIAIDSKYKGLGFASHIFKEVEEMCLKRGIHSIRIDTHEANHPMQRLLRKNKFKYCGIIYLDDGSKRLAYEKLL